MYWIYIYINRTYIQRHKNPINYDFNLSLYIYICMLYYVLHGYICILDVGGKRLKSTEIRKDKASGGSVIPMDIWTADHFFGLLSRDHNNVRCV